MTFLSTSQYQMECLRPSSSEGSGAHRELTPHSSWSISRRMVVRKAKRRRSKLLLRLEYRVRYYDSCLAPSVYGDPSLSDYAAFREPRSAWVLLRRLLDVALGTIVPALASLPGAPMHIRLDGVTGLQQIGRWSPEASRSFCSCLIPFVFWYGLLGSRDYAVSMMRYETSGRSPTQSSVASCEQPARGIPRRDLVFGRYSPRHLFQDEWVYNEASIDAARITCPGREREEKAKLRAAVSGSRRDYFWSRTVRPCHGGAYVP